MGFRMLIGGVVMCLCHCYSIVCSWDFGGEGPEDIFSMVSHVSGICEF